MNIQTNIKSNLKGLLLLGVCLPVAIATQAQNSYITTSPEQVEVQENDTFSVAVNVVADAEALNVVDVHLKYDAEYLEVLAVSAGQEDLFNYHVQPAFDNGTGRIDMAAFKLGDEVLNGTYEVMNITFRALAETPMTDVRHPMNAFPKTLLAYRGENKLNTATDLMVTILPGTVLSTEVEEKEKHGLGVFPNPAMNESTVTFRPAVSGRADVRIFDAAGKLVDVIFSETAVAGIEYRLEFGVQNYAAGTYTLSLQIGSEVVSTPVIVGK